MAKKRIKRTKAPVTSELTTEYVVPTAATESMFSSSRLRKIVLALIILAIVGLVLWRNKNWFVVATVNGQLVPRWELEEKLIKRYGAQTLDEVVNERLIRQAAASASVTVTDQEIDSKISEVEKSFAGKISLEEALSQQGMTLEEFKNQIELQLLLEKLTASSIAVTDQEISDYLEKNRSLLPATDEANLKEEARRLVLSQKKNENFRKFFEDLKAKAKVTKFI